MNWIVSGWQAIAAGASKSFRVGPGLHFVQGLNNAAMKVRQVFRQSDGDEAGTFWIMKTGGGEERLCKDCTRLSFPQGKLSGMKLAAPEYGRLSYRNPGRRFCLIGITRFGHIDTVFPYV
jgi:hypothetical protein